MAISIEVWINGNLVGGTELWWDDIENSLGQLHSAKKIFPLISRVDPYGDTIFVAPDVDRLRAEFRRFKGQVSRPAVAEVADDLIALCELAVRSTGAELRFIGD